MSTKKNIIKKFLPHKTHDARIEKIGIAMFIIIGICSMALMLDVLLTP